MWIPLIGKVYSLIPDSEDKDIEQAVQAAELAFDNWSNSSIDYRSKILTNIAKLILKNVDDLARAESIDNGKPLSLAKKIDIPRAAKNMAFFASAIKHDSAESHQMNNIAINYTLRKPIGVVGCISPWNLPLSIYLEDCSSISRRQYCNRKTLRSYSYDRLLVFKNM